MRHSFLFQCSMLAGGMLLLLLWGSTGDWEIPQLSPTTDSAGKDISEGTGPAVTILLIPDAEGVRAIRHAIDPDRIVASSPDAFALAEGRIVATSVESASGPLNQAGWSKRPIEIVTPPSRATPRFESARSSSREAAPADAVSALKDKRVLTRNESIRLLNEMSQRGDF